MSNKHTDYSSPETILASTSRYNKVLTEMLDEMERAPVVLRPPKLEGETGRLESLNIDTFKSLGVHRDLAFKSSSPIRSLQAKLPKTFQIKNRVKAVFSPKFSCFSKRKSINYTYLTLLMWDYLACNLPKKLVEIEEPALGDPLFVKWQNRFVTEDLANSLLEFHAITSDVEQSRIRIVLELGGGYGRLGYVFLKQWPTIKYVLVDHPAALFIAQNYLAKVFEGRKVFRFRSFKSFDEIKEEFEDSDICFFLPHQMELLPSYSIDLGINISTFQEMKREQVHYYFNHFSRLVSAYFYFKELREPRARSGKEVMREADYPVPYEWEEMFWRPCPVHTQFFEALFKAST